MSSAIGDRRRRTGRRPAGMLWDMADPTLAATRIQRFLAEEPIVWLSTVRPDGAPHIVPIWFWWDGESLLVFSKPDAQKVRNLRADPRVMLALGDAEDDFDVGMVEGRAELLDAPTGVVLPADHLDKYRVQLATLGLDAVGYAATYSQVIRIRPTRYLGWHGRAMPMSVRVAGAPARSIAEPARVEHGGLVRRLGEPLAALRSLPALPALSGRPGLPGRPGLGSLGATP